MPTLRRLRVNECCPACRARLADAVDAFCDTIGFSREQTQRVFDAARAHGLPVKLHAEQLSDQGGAALAARVRRAVGRPSREASDAGVAAMASAGTVAVLLPGAYYFLRETRLPPIEALREAACRWRSRPIAIPARRRRCRRC